MIKLNSVYKKYKKGSFFSEKEFYALKDINLAISEGEHIGIIGESGAGKTSLGKILSLIESPTSGSVFFDSESVNKKNIKRFIKKVGAVFQDPYTSLDPKLRILDILKETGQKMDFIYEICFNLNMKKELLKKYPGQLSGGEQQRTAIARTLLSNPEYIIFDEISSALDMSTQAKIVNLLCDINKDKEYTYIFISHDIKLADFISDRIYVLYGGYIIEEYKNTVANPLHPYTKMLFSDEWNIDDTDESYQGCFFYNLCRHKKDICRNGVPAMNRADKNHSLRCFLYD